MAKLWKTAEQFKCHEGANHVLSNIYIYIYIYIKQTHNGRVKRKTNTIFLLMLSTKCYKSEDQYWSSIVLDPELSPQVPIYRKQILGEESTE